MSASYVINGYVLINVISATIALIVGLYAILRGTRKDKSISLMLAVMFFWCCALAIEYAVVGIPQKVFWAKLEYLGVQTIPVLFLNHILLITSPGQPLFHRKLGWLFIIPVATILLAATNEYHHLIWTTFTPGPAGTNLVDYGHGPLFWVFSVGYSYLLMAVSAVILFRWAKKQPKENMGTILRTASAGILPWVANGLYVFNLLPVKGLEIATFSFVVSGFILELDIQMDDRKETHERQQQMATAITALNSQIEAREKLEEDLLASRAALSARLTNLNSSLIGLFDLLLLTGEKDKGTLVINQSLEKVREVLNCRALVFFQSEPSDMKLAGSIGLDKDEQTYMHGIHPDWNSARPVLEHSGQVVGSNTLPEVFLAGKFKLAAGKLLQTHDRHIGYLCALWQDSIELGDEDTILINGTFDTFGLLYEYSRLSRLIADTAKSQERRRLAQDLHDSTTQSLQSLIFMAETAKFHQQNNPEKLTGTLDTIISVLHQVLKEMRLLLYELRLGNPLETNLVTILRSRLAAVEERAGVVVVFKVDPEFFLPKYIEAEIYPLVMEVLNNSMKHAHAKNLNIQFHKLTEGESLLIEDDGVGFDPAAEHEGGMGLLNIRDRCERVGAKLSIKSHPGLGCSVRVLIPG